MPDIVAALAVFRSHLSGAINVMLPSPEAPLLEGILLGGGKLLPPETWEAFRHAGLLHVVAVSGTNVALVIAAINASLFWLPRTWRYPPAILMVAAYTILSGASASAVRAAVMGVLALTALQLGRQVHRRRLMAAAFLIMVAYNPRWLTEDAGFQLSFLAVLGIAEIGPILDPWMKRLPTTFGIRECLLMSTAAELSASPWSAHLFGGFSLISPLANLLVTPAIPLSMLTGTIALIAHFLSPFLGQLFVLPCYLFLRWMIDWTEYLGTRSFAIADIQPSLTVTVVYYATLIGVVLWMQRRTARKEIHDSLAGGVRATGGVG